MAVLLIILLLVLLSIFLSSVVIPFPVNDSGTVRYNTLPFVTGGLIAINTLVFALFQAPDLIDYLLATNEIDEFNAIYSFARTIGTYGFRESFVREGESIGAFTTFTSTFMHSDFNHLISNMIFLWAFGRRVEDACGPWRFLMFYLFAGMVATMGYAILTSANSDLPGIGASGAIFGVMGAYLLLFPSATMNCLWGIALGLRFLLELFQRFIGEKPASFRWTTSIPAFFVLALYAGFNVLPTFRTIREGDLVGGVNYVAHLTGFLSAITIFLFVRKDLLTRYWAGRTL